MVRLRQQQCATEKHHGQDGDRSEDAVRIRDEAVPADENDQARSNRLTKRHRERVVAERGVMPTGAGGVGHRRLLSDDQAQMSGTEDNTADDQSVDTVADKHECQRRDEDQARSGKHHSAFAKTVDCLS